MAWPALLVACQSHFVEFDGDAAGCDDPEVFFTDADGDGHGAGAPIESCEATAGLVPSDDDCDDDDANVHPGADDDCDGIDDDCDGEVDEGLLLDFATDADGDSFGDDHSWQQACELPLDAVTTDGDCDDDDARVNPDAQEVCNGIDDDCDGLVDGDDDSVDISEGGRPFYIDGDSDGYGLAGTGEYACDAPDGTSPWYEDCDDENAAVNPGAEERCNGIDDDCDGVVDWDLWVPEDYPTIAEAMDAAEDGETVCVSTGTYAERLDWNGKDVMVEGADGSGNTVLDGEGSGPVATFATSESREAGLRGFTVTGGVAYQGAGIYVSGADPTLDDVVVGDNECPGTNASCYGAGLYCENGDPSVTDSAFTHNVAAAIYPVSSRAYMYGAGVYLENCDAVFQAVDITDNLATKGPDTWAYAVLWYGIGLHGANSDLVWSGGVVSGNAVPEDYGNGYLWGGGLYFKGGRPSLSNVVIADNSLGEVIDSQGAGIYAALYADVTLTNVVLAGNRSVGWTAVGGGLKVSNGASVALENCDLVGNVAEDTSGSHEAAGGAIHSDRYCDVDMVNTNVVGNVADVGGALAGTSTSSVVARVSYSNFFSNGSAAFEYYEDPSGSDGNAATDPLYVDTSASTAVDWDLTLTEASPCIDAGDPDRLDPDGSVSDIGAFGGEGAAEW